ncbi:MAG TPA: hypothetical protein VG498_11650 [Terriglobales bacterium]|nr:hypothetical protein [Terriglobales bacterium]
MTLLVGSTLYAQTIPHTESETLSGKKIILPDAFSGHPVLITIGFSRAGGDSAGRWGRDLRKELSGSPELRFYTIAAIQDAPKMIRGMIKHGMRSGTPKTEHDSFVVLENDENAWKKLAEFSDANDAYLLLVDSQAKVVWRAHGRNPDSQTLSGLKGEVAKVLNANKGS